MTSKNKVKEESKEIIRVEIIDSKPNGFYIRDLDTLELKSLEIKDLEFRLNVSTLTNNEEKSLKIELELDGFLINNGVVENDGIFGIKSSTVFRTPEYNTIVDSKGNIKGPKGFITKLLNICIGGIRGMLAVNLVNTALSNITLPLLDVTPIVKEHPNH